MMFFPPGPIQPESADDPRDESTRDLARKLLNSGLSQREIEQKLVEQGLDHRNAKWILADRQVSDLTVSNPQLSQSADEPHETERTVGAVVVWMLLTIADLISGGCVTIVLAVGGMVFVASRVIGVSIEENQDELSVHPPDEASAATGLPNATGTLPQEEETCSEPEVNSFVRVLIFLLIGLAIVSLAVTISIAV